MDRLPSTQRAPDGSRAPLAAPAQRRRVWLSICLCLVAAIALAYGRSFQGDFHFDDRFDIERAVKGFSGDPAPVLERLRERQLRHLDRRLLTDLTLFLNHRWGGFEPFGYHLVNLAIHMGVALALYGLVRRTLLLPRFAGRHEASAATLACVVALVFGVHPLTTQAVTYIVQRGEALAALFQLLALVGLVRAATGGPRAWVGAVWLAGLLGAASKEVMVTAPALALLYDHVFLRGLVAARGRRIAAHVGLWVAVLGFFFYTGFLEHALFPDPLRVTNMGLGFQGTTPWRYLLTQCEVVLHYLRLALWPSGLVLDYGWRFVERPSAVLLEGLVLLALLAASVVLLVRRHWSGFAGCAFFLLLAPTSSIIPIVDAAFEHRMYLPLAALVTLAVGGGLALLRRWLDDERLARRALVVLALCLAVALALATHARNAVYRSQESMWADVVAKRPENARGLLNLGKARRVAGHPDAEELVRRSIALDPTEPKAFYELGLALERRGDGQGARAAYERALALDPLQVESNTALGMLLFMLARDSSGALRHLRMALSAAPDNAFVHYDLGLVQQGMGNLALALGSYERALELDPGYLPSATKKALCLAGLERFPEAEATLRAALARADPLRDRGELVKIHTNLGSLLFSLGRFDEAGACFERALAVDPQADDLQFVWHNLGLVRERQGQLGTAVDAYRRALALAPDHTESRAALARLGG